MFEADRIMTSDEIEHTRRLYAAEILAADRAVGDLLDGLDAAGLLDGSVIGFTSDHGEALGGHHRYWFAHGEFLYDDTLRVPMAFRAPGVVPAETVVAENALLQDFAPTLLGLAGLPPLDRQDGVDLSPRLRGETGRAVAERVSVHFSDHLLVREQNPRRYLPGREGRWLALRHGSQKLIRIPTGTGEPNDELYDVSDDPEERTDLSQERPGLVAELSTILAERLRQFRPIVSEAESPEPDLETLESLGYAGR